MNLECLPNETLLDLFEYVNSVGLLRAFYGLNSRFNLILYKQFRAYRFDFPSISKHTFDMICQQHLPFIADRVIDLRLSENDETPEEINLFWAYISSFNRFTHLQSLTLSYLNSHKTLLLLLDECRHLNNLMYLNISSDGYLSNDQVNCQLIVDNIWSLPKLIKCHLNINIEKHNLFCLPTIISLSLKSVTTHCSQLKMNQINQLLEYTPRLKHLSTGLAKINDDYIPFPLPMIIDLNIDYYSPRVNSKMIFFLQNVPNLRHLDINIGSELIDGHQWEHIIRNYLPKLKTFRLLMYIKSSFDENIQKQLDKLIDSFRSSFWIDEHQWFVRCFIHDTTIYLHTVSSLFNWSPDLDTNSWRSTYPHEDYQSFHNSSINSINAKTFFDKPIPSHIRLSNIKYLNIQFPINDQLWSIVPSLNRLKSLTVSSYADTFQSQLQTLLDRAPNLYTLIIRQDALLPLQMSLFTCKNTSVRRFNLHRCKHCFNEEECITLSYSPLGIQCEVLSIKVNNRESIIHLVKNMINLRILYVYWNYEQFQLIQNYDKLYYKRQILDKLVQWLKDRLPSTCVVMNDRDYPHGISIWI